MAEDREFVTIQTPGGEISWKEDKSREKANFDDLVEPLSEDELAALKRYSDRAPAFIASFVSPDHQTGNILEEMDTAFAGWLKTGQRDRLSADDVIQIIGSTLGTYSIRHLGLRWARITDTQGTAIALVSDQPPTRSFPFTSVQYRIEDNKTDFIYALFASLEHLMENAKK